MSPDGELRGSVMAIPMFDLEQIPAYHEDILILKVRSQELLMRLR